MCPPPAHPAIVDTGSTDEEIVLFLGERKIGDLTPLNVITDVDPFSFEPWDSPGSLCNCLLPEALKISPVQHDPDYQAYDGEKRRLTSAFSCLSSISMRQRQLSASSLFLPSPLKGCLPPWEWRRSPSD